MNVCLKKLSTVFVFYAFLTYVLFPFLFYKLVSPSVGGIGKGFIVGSAVSVILWHFYGQKYV